MFSCFERFSGDYQPSLTYHFPFARLCFEGEPQVISRPIRSNNSISKANQWFTCIFDSMFTALSTCLHIAFT